MLRCTNCNGPVDERAASCPRCGRPNAGEEAKNLQNGGCLVVVLVVIGFLAYSWFTDSGDNQAAVAPSSSPAPMQTPQEPYRDRGAMEEQEHAPSVSQEVVSEQIDPPEQSDVVPSADTFKIPAVLRDDRGHIVLQSGPLMRSKNVTTLPSGTRVLAETEDGKWIQVRTTDGLTGYVRQRQLEFLGGQNQL